MMEEGVTVINQDELKDFSEDEGATPAISKVLWRMPLCNVL
jgi:hypothetical protein